MFPVATGCSIVATIQAGQRVAGEQHVDVAGVDHGHHRRPPRRWTTPGQLFLQLLGAPLAAVTVVSEVLQVCGWSVPEAEVKRMLFVWRRVAHVPPDDPTT
jgi:hypothetical protein